MFKLVRNPDPRKKPPYGSRLDPTHPLSQGLVGCWLLNEGGGNKVWNLAQNKHHGSFVNSPEWIRDYVNFVHADADYISCGTEPLGIANQLTVDVVALSVSDTNGRLVTKTASSLGLFLSRYEGGDSLEFRLSTTGSDWNGGTTPSNTFPTYNELHFICTYDGSYMRVFIDGIEQGGDFPHALSGNVKDSTQDIELGRCQRSGDTFSLNGYIKHARIWSRALSEGEREQLNAEPYAHILVPQYWHMVDFGAGVGEVPMAVKMSYYLRQMGA